MALQNWAGTYTYRARAVHTPSTLDELRAVVVRAPKVRALGSRHSFSDIADSAELVSLDGVPSQLVIDRDALTVTCGSAVRYGELATALQSEGLALANLASLPHIAVGAQLLGVNAATEQKHPIDGLDPIHANPQLGVPGPWFDRLPHFRMGFTPSAGAEIQSEYIVARRHAVDAIGGEITRRRAARS